MKKIIKKLFYYCMSNDFVTNATKLAQGVVPIGSEEVIGNAVHVNTKLLQLFALNAAAIHRRRRTSDSIEEDQTYTHTQAAISSPDNPTL